MIFHNRYNMPGANTESREFKRGMERMRHQTDNIMRHWCIDEERVRLFVDGHVSLDPAVGWSIAMYPSAYEALKREENVLLEMLERPIIKGCETSEEFNTVSHCDSGNGQSVVRKPEARSIQILHALARMGFKPESIKIYQPPEADIDHPDHRTDVYKIIEVQSLYSPEVIAHIAVCDYYGRGVYVIRDPNLLDLSEDGAVLEKDELYDSPWVWKVRDFTADDRWDVLRDYIFTSLDELQPQNKRRVLWHNKLPVLKEAVLAFHNEHGRLPDFTDREAGRVITGESSIAGATWAAAYQAMKRGTIAGVSRDAGGFQVLLEQALEERIVVFPVPEVACG